MIIVKNVIKIHKKNKKKKKYITIKNAQILFGNRGIARQSAKLKILNLLILNIFIDLEYILDVIKILLFK